MATSYDPKANYQALINAEMAKSNPNTSLITQYNDARNAKIDSLGMTSTTKNSTDALLAQIKSRLGGTNSVDVKVEDKTQSLNVPTYTKVENPVNEEDKTSNPYSFDGQTTNVTVPTVETAVTKPKTAEELRAEYIANMAGFKPSIEQGTYVANAANLAQAIANSQYDPLKDDLKNRVAKVLSGLGIRAGTLDTKYRPQYQQNEVDKYGAGEEIKKLLARRGMLGSGVELGSQSQNIAKYDALKQGIDIAKQNEDTQILADMELAKQQGENDLAGIDKQKANYVAQAQAQAVQNYDNLVAQEKAQASDNFWKSSELGNASYNSETQRIGIFGGLKLDTVKLQEQIKEHGDSVKMFYDKMDNDNKQFFTNIGLEYDKLNATQKNFYDNLQTEMTKFAVMQTNEMFTRAKELGFKYDELAQNNQIASNQLKYNYKALEQENSLAYARMANDIATANIGASVARDKFNWEKDQFEANQKKYLANPQLDPEMRDLYQKETARFMNVLGTNLDLLNRKDQTGKSMPGITQSQFAAVTTGAAKLAIVDEVTRSNMFKMLGEITGTGKK